MVEHSALVLLSERVMYSICGMIEVVLVSCRKYTMFWGVAHVSQTGISVSQGILKAGSFCCFFKRPFPHLIAHIAVELQTCALAERSI